MCGLGGYKNLFCSSFTIDESLLFAMQNVIKNRGPDGAGTWFSNEKQIALMHRRLKIVDLSERAKQPMLDKRNSVAISFNGEIYNHLSLRKCLEEKGFRYFSDSDTETLLYAYMCWGIEFIDRLDGMFSFALYDNNLDKLYLVRDRIGVKPMYFSLQNGILSFSSEIKALWKLPWNTRELNPNGLNYYLTYLVTPAPMTIYKGIYKLPAGFYLKVDSKSKVTFHEWYTPIIKIDGSFDNEDFCIDGIQNLFRNSVEKRMMSDVPMGVFLSGGIDSSLNVALMSEFTDKVKTFSVAFHDGPEYNEIEWARKVSKKFNTEHYEVFISEKQAFDFFEQMVYHQDEPISDCVCVPLYYVSKLLKDSGVTVVQVGEGSDELFCGYSSYASMINFYNKYWIPSKKFTPNFVRQKISPLLGNILSYFYRNSSHLFECWGQDRSIFWSGATAFYDCEKKNIFKKNNCETDDLIDQIYPGFSQNFDCYSLVEFHLRKLMQLDPNADFLKTMIYLELKHRLPELLLMRIDKMTMVTSVEARVPFLDHKLVEFSLNIPSGLKYKNGITKYILKKACENRLPREVIYRKKMGFAAPISRWFKNGKYFQIYFQDMLNSKAHLWEEFFYIKNVRNLVKSNITSNSDLSLQLWVLQNLMACEL